MSHIIIIIIITHVLLFEPQGLGLAVGKSK